MSECRCTDGMDPKDARDARRHIDWRHELDCRLWTPVRTVDDVESLDVPSDVQGYL